MHRVQSIRNQCLTLISSLIEVFGDDAVQAVLFVQHNMFTSKQKQEEGKESNENPWLARINLAYAGQDNSDDDDEEVKAPMQEGVDPEELKEMQRQKREAKEFKALLQETVFMSSHKKNDWKRKEVAILLVSSFIKDISAYLIRNPVYDQMLQMFERVVLADFSQAPTKLRLLLHGRAL